MRRLLTILIILVALVVIPVAGVWGAHSARSARPKPTQPPTTPVTRGDVERTVTLPGQLIGIRQARLSFGVSGKLAQINVRPGDPVQAGAILAVLERASFERAVVEAQLRLAKAQLDFNTTEKSSESGLALAAAVKNLQVARTNLAGAQAAFTTTVTLANSALQDAQRAYEAALREYNHALDLKKWGLVGDERVDAARAALDKVQVQLEAARLAAAGAPGKAQADIAAAQQAYYRALGDYDALKNANPLKAAQIAVDQAQLDLQKAERDLAATTLYAPFQGVVLDVTATPGEWIAVGHIIIELSDPTAVEVVTTAIEEDIPLIQAGQAASLFLDAVPDVDLTGHVTRIVPRRVPGKERPLYEVYLSLESPTANLLPGMTMDAVITLERRTNVLRVPRVLVRKRDNTSVVMTWEGTAIQERTVRTGLKGDLYVEIVDGLHEGELIVNR